MGNPNNEFLRHTLATIAYRFQKSVSRTADEFGSYNLGHGARTPSEIVNHIYEVSKATREFIQDGKYDDDLESLNFKQEIERFNAELQKFDIVLIEKNLDIEYSKRLLQGPLSDILTHIGQIAMMTRLHGNPIAKEKFASAPIEVGILSYF